MKERMGKNEQRGAHTHNTKNRARSAAAACCCASAGFSVREWEIQKDPKRHTGAANQKRGRHEDLDSCPVRDRKLGLPVRSHAGEISYFLSGELRSTA